MRNRCVSQIVEAEAREPFTVQIGAVGAFLESAGGSVPLTQWRSDLGYDGPSDVFPTLVA
jgi:hypothetical protein